MIKSCVHALFGIHAVDEIIEQEHDATSNKWTASFKNNKTRKLWNMLIGARLHDEIPHPDIKCQKMTIGTFYTFVQYM